MTICTGLHLLCHRQTDSFSLLYDMSGNLNVSTCCVYYWGVRQRCTDNCLNQAIFLFHFPLHSCSKQSKNKLMTPTFNKKFSFFLIAWVLNSDNSFIISVVIQKWNKQLRVLKYSLYTNLKKNWIAIFIHAQDNSALQF